MTVFWEKIPSASTNIRTSPVAWRMPRFRAAPLPALAWVRTVIRGSVAASRAHQLGRVVSGAVIHEHHLVPVVQGELNGADTVFDDGRLVESRDNDRHAGPLIPQGGRCAAAPARGTEFKPDGQRQHEQLHEPEHQDRQAEEEQEVLGPGDG